jgi:hypothetical protein
MQDERREKCSVAITIHAKLEAGWLYREMGGYNTVQYNKMLV